MFIVIMLVLTGCCYGFLFDSTTQSAPTRAPFMTDTHFNMLMELLHEERQSRIYLENFVKQLQQDMITSKQDVYTQVMGNINRTIGALINDNAILKENNRNLQKKYDSLSCEFDQLKHNYTVTVERSVQLESDALSFQQLKTIANLQSVLNLTNDTERLFQVIQVTTNKLNAVISDASARQQDFIALFNKMESMEKQFEITKEIESIELYNVSQVLQMTNNKLDYVINEANVRKQDFLSLFNKVEATEKKFEIKTKELERDLHNCFLQEQRLGESQNITTSKLDQQISILNKLSNRAFAAACVKNDTTVKHGNTIFFQDIRTTNGITDIELFKSSGVFTCEVSGTYLIAAFVQTNSHIAGFNIMKNSTIYLADAFMSLTEHYQTSTAIIIDNLSVNDTISITTRRLMTVYGGYESCLTILQVQ